MLANNIGRSTYLPGQYGRCWTLPSLFILLLLSFGLTPLVFATNTKEEQVKVSYIYNFAKFIKWPETVITNDTSPFTICIKGTRPLSGNILQLQGRQLNGHKIEIRSFNKVAEPRQCNILFIGDSEQYQLKKILQQVSSLPVLTISDLSNFADNGGMIGMKALDNRVRFDINLGAAQKVELQIDSQLLKLALRVIP